MALCYGDNKKCRLSFIVESKRLLFRFIMIQYRHHIHIFLSFLCLFICLQWLLPLFCLFIYLLKFFLIFKKKKNFFLFFTFFHLLIFSFLIFYSSPSPFFQLPVFAPSCCLRPPPPPLSLCPSFALLFRLHLAFFKTIQSVLLAYKCNIQYEVLEADRPACISFSLARTAVTRQKLIFYYILIIVRFGLLKIYIYIYRIL